MNKKLFRESFNKDTLAELKSHYRSYRYHHGYKFNSPPLKGTKNEIIELLLALYNIEFKKMAVYIAQNELNHKIDKVKNWGYSEKEMNQYNPLSKKPKNKMIKL
jgi:hypothetical protein